MNIDEFMLLKKKVDRLSRNAAKDEGRMEQLQARLKEEFNCNSLEEAEKKLQKLLDELSLFEEKYLTASKNFKKKWRKVLK